MEFDTLKKLISSALKIDPEIIKEESEFVRDLGADSLDLFEIVIAVEEEYDIEISTEAMGRIDRVSDACALIRELVDRKE